MDTLNILVVDDDRDFADALTDVLEAENHRVDRCYSGEDAVEAFGRKNYDLSFMDVKLPRKNGVESFLEIRRRKPDARVVMMTGYSMERLLHQALENGAWAVMHKPLDMTQVLGIVDAISPASLVLIIDEEPSFIRALTDALSKAGLRAVHADGGEDGARLIREGGTDLVILDMSARLEGVFAVFEEIRKQGLEPPGIIVTGEPPQGDLSLTSLRRAARVEVQLKPCDVGDVARLALAMVGRG
jgi:two-component system response regulator HydG